MAELELERVSMFYGATRVLEDISLQVADGAFHAMVGPSGSGKTSILKLLAGFARPAAGRVLIDTRDVTGVPPERRELGIVFQNYALFPHMTVGQNVAFGLRMRKCDRRESLRRVADVLDLVDLTGLEGRYPTELSGGQQQRVALARALVIEPKALLLDEPLSALDRKIRLEMQIELRRIQREAGVTAVIVTHDQEEALALGDRLIVLDAGRIQQEGTPFQVYKRPSSPFVATFLGKANMFEATVLSAGDGSIRVGDLVATGVVLPAGTVAGASLTFCVRPEHWQIDISASRTGPTAHGLTLEGPVSGLRQTGETGTGVVDTALGSVSFTVLSPRLAELDVGRHLRLSVGPEDMHFF